MSRRVTIDDTEVTVKDWLVSNKLGGRSTMSATIVYPTVTAPQVYQVIKIFDTIAESGKLKNPTLFAGIITQVKPKYQYPCMEWVVSAIDYSRLADYRIVSFAAEHMTVGDIIRTYIIPVLAAEGVTAGVIAEGVTAIKVVFSLATCADILDALTELCGDDYYWQITASKQLRFLARTATQSGVHADSTVHPFGVTYTVGSDDYRNVQYIIGATSQTAMQTETLTVNDGVYMTRYPIAITPRIYVNGVESAAVGVQGLADNPDYTWAYESKSITYTGSGTASATIQICYVGLATIITRKQNAGEIIRISASGGSGVRETVYTDETIDSTAQAEQYADALLTKYAKNTEKITFVVEANLWVVGELVYVDMPNYGLADWYMCTAISASAADADRITYKITLSGGSSYDGWIEFFAKMASKPSGLKINEDSIALIVQSIAETSTRAGATTAMLIQPRPCGVTVKCNTTLTVGIIVSSDTMID